MIALTTCFYKIDKIYILARIQGRGGNRTQNPTKTKRREPNKSYVEGLHNLESWRVNKSKDKITRDGQYWWLCPKHKIEGKFDGIYMKYTANKNDERA